jgi:uncharacterized protein with ParB-like and HNH nuclease domain
MNKIDSRSKTVREMLDGAKYSIEYYQREYKWETKQIAELLEDLEARFFSSYEEGHERKQVREYAPYFLGSVIINSEDGTDFVIDGQQRLTSLTLLLIYLNNLQRESANGEVAVDSLIFSEQFGERSFNFDVSERTTCMEALYRGEYFDASESPESVRNLVARYADIEHLFPDTLKDGALLYFIDWLKEKVELVQITAYSDDDAYMIFETMNDRGLGLTPTDMLKGYLLANISDLAGKEAANAVWKQRLLDLSELGGEGAADFLKTWVRAKYAQSIRERKKDASNADFEKIGTELHKWVRDENNRKNLIGLDKSADFDEFIRIKFDRFSKHYICLRRAASQMTPRLEDVYYNAYNDFTLQYPLLLAPLRTEDDEDIVLRKLRLVSGYLDIYIARRIVNFKTLSYSSLSYTMFNLVKEIRDLDVAELAVVLKARLDDMWETFDAVSNFYMHQQNRWRVHYLLARITHHIEDESGVPSDFDSYVSRQIKKPYEVEHIWADKYERHTDQFESEDAFHQYRNRIGGLLLLPRGFNQSYGDMPYAEKVNKYIEQNLLAKTLHPQCYINNPSFLAYKERSDLPFRAYPETFNKKDLDGRQELYRRICEDIWNPARLDQEVGSAALTPHHRGPRAAHPRT